MGRHLAGAAATLTAIAALAVLCATRWDDVAGALDAVSPGAFVAAVALHVGTLVLRTEAWRLALGAVQDTPLPRRAVHGANAGAFLAGALQSHLALPVRVALLRRLEPARAPRPAQICVADAPIFLLELCFVALLLAAGIVAGAAAWWTAPCALAIAAGALLVARRLLARWADRPFAQGLAVLGDVRRRGALVLLVAGIGSLGAVRVWLVLAACGLPHGLGAVAVLFAALGVFGLLPIGPGASPGASLATHGAGAVGAAVATGLLLSASSIAAVALYALGVAAWSRTDRPEVRHAAVQLEGAKA